MKGAFIPLDGRIPPITDLKAVPFGVQLTRQFRSTTHREGMVIAGEAGCGEWAPFPEYDDVTAARWLRGALEWANLPVPQAFRDEIPINLIVPASQDWDGVYERTLADVAATGCTVVKVKVAEAGQSFADDTARVDAVRRALDDAGAPHGTIRIDVNGAWSALDALERVPILAAVAGGLEYVEQPCADLADCARVREAGVAVAVDEGVRRDLVSALDDERHEVSEGHMKGGIPTVGRNEGPLHRTTRAALHDAADVVVVKAVPVGGVRRALELIDWIGLPVVVSGAMDTSVGLATGIALASALPHLDYACGFGTGSLLAADLAPTTRPRNGVVPVRRVDPDPELLERARLTGQRADWWQARLSRCLDLLRQTPPL